MKRITVTLTDEQHERLCMEARRRRLGISEIIREKVDEDLTREASLPGFVGLANVQLPYTSLDIDTELAKTFGRS
jgi:ribbon-helix-helix CopG family protein